MSPMFFYVPVVCSSLSMPRFLFVSFSNIMLPALGLRSACDGIVDALRFPFILLGQAFCEKFHIPKSFLMKQSN